MVETSEYIIRKIEHGIIENHILDKTVVDTDLTRKLKRHNHSVSGGKPYCIFIHADPFTSITTEARKMISSKEYLNETKAVAKAIMVQSLPQRIICNFYLRFNKPHLPTRLFTDKESALEWLRKFHD